MKKIISLCLCMVCPMLSGCDLQPKIVGLPNSIDEFITDRYPALLADPQSDIYNSAASDYGIYASPDLYGVYSESTDDYLLYANVSDYQMPQYGTLEQPQVPLDTTTDIVVDEVGDYLVVGMYGGDIQPDANVIAKPATDVVKTESVKSIDTTRVAIKIITVAPGDTLYSISRKYEIPVNDLAVMNNIETPFALSVGQVLKVPDLKSVGTETVAMTTKDSATVAVNETKITKTPVTVTLDVPAKAPVKKISSDPTKQLPKIATRSASKFSWPVRGRVISEYGAKSNGLFNDGINIAATRGSVVRSAENGVVAYAGNEVKGMGNLIIVQHSDGWMTVYAHMDSMNVKRGSKVAVGDKIGTVGTSGKVDEPQLHFEVRKGTKAYNPTQYLKN